MGGFAGSDDSQPLTDRLDPDGVSTYGEDCLVPEPHKVRLIALRGVIINNINLNLTDRVNFLTVGFTFTILYLHVYCKCVVRVGFL